MDRYNQEGGNSSLTIDAPEASPLLSLFQPSNDLPPGPNYTHDSAGFYPPSGSIFTPDGRLRLSSKYVVALTTMPLPTNTNESWKSVKRRFWQR